MQTDNTSQVTKHKQDYMHGAAMIDDKGKEVPITEDMIQQAVKNILETCQAQ